MPRTFRFDTLESRQLLSTVLASVGKQPIGPLTGKIVYAAAGHGLAANSSGVWATGRPETNEMVEDLGTQDQLTLYADELWHAGATVVPMRPVGHQLNEVIVDNQQATYTGTWANGSGSPYFSTTNGSGVGYRTAIASGTETAVAKFTPNIPTSGNYPVYAWASDGTNREADQLYRVNHAGGSTEVKINHRLVGKGWVYLGTYYFRAGQGGSVDVSNKSGNSAGSTTIADAIRFGNGMGSVVRNGLTSGAAREDEASLYWVEAQAGWTGSGVRVPSSTWRSLTLDSDANVGAPLRWSAYMNAAPLGQSLYLSFHSNAGNGAGRGGLGLYNNDTLFPGTATPNQFALAKIMGDELLTDMSSLGTLPGESKWSGTPGVTATTLYRTDYAFGEIRWDTANHEFDATILEVAYHDNVADAGLLRNPIARQRVAQATTQGTIQYFNQFGGGTLAYAPERPTNLRTGVDANGNIVLNWDAVAPLSKFGGVATGYRVYASRDGYSFDGGQAVTGTTLTIPKAQIGTGTVYFKVVATNAGGESAATAVVATRIGDSRYGRILIVDGFDRLSRSQDPRQSLAIGGVNSSGNQAAVATFDRVRPGDSNSFNYAVQHAQAIANHPSNLGVDTADNLAVINGNVDLSAYRAVIWISGEESTVDHTFAAAEQTAVTSYLNKGGKLFVSGSEIGWDLDASGNGAAFFNNALHADYAGDDAGTYGASGATGSIFSGISLNFDNGTGGTYDVDYPDQLAPINGSTAVLNYAGGLGGIAATAWKSATTGAATILLGFPFETITNSAVRASLMRKALDSFGFSTLAPAPVKRRPVAVAAAATPAAAPTPTPSAVVAPAAPTLLVASTTKTAAKTAVKRVDANDLVDSVLA